MWRLSARVRKPTRTILASSQALATLRKAGKSMFQTKKTSKKMKKTIWSLAALMLMAAPVMTSCSNDLDEVAPVEETKSNVVTITIAPPAAEPETRVAMTDNVVTGWALNDEVTLYKVSENGDDRRKYYAITGTGVTFKCIDAAAGTFRGDLEGNDINDYTFAVYGGENVLQIGDYPEMDGELAIVPKTMYSENLKDVVMMAAYNSGSGYTMQVVNSVMKVTNSGEEAEVAWSVTDYNPSDADSNPEFITPLITFNYNGYVGFTKASYKFPSDYKGWTNAKHITLKNGVTYVNMGVCGHGNEYWGLAKQDGTQVVARKKMNGRSGKKGKLYTVSI